MLIPLFEVLLSGDVLCFIPRKSILGADNSRLPPLNPIFLHRFRRGVPKFFKLLFPKLVVEGLEII